MERPRFKSRFHYSFAMWLWASSLASLSLSCLIYKMGIILVLSSWGCMRIKWDCLWKILAECLAHGKLLVMAIHHFFRSVVHSNIWKADSSLERLPSCWYLQFCTARSLTSWIKIYLRELWALESGRHRIWGGSAGARNILESSYGGMGSTWHMSYRWTYSCCNNCVRYRPSRHPFYRWKTTETGGEWDYLKFHTQWTADLGPDPGKSVPGALPRQAIASP